MGGSISTSLSLGLIAILLMLRLRKCFNMHLLSIVFYRDTFFAVLAMVVTVLFFLKIEPIVLIHFPYERTVSAIFSVTGTLIGGCVYIVFLLWRNVFKDHEWSLLPLGNKILYFKNQIIKKG